jgi:CRISPR-associated exonuclease Cas4
MHERAHNQNLTEKRGNLLTTRALPVVSHSLKVQGVCDVVEFRQDTNGVKIYGRKGLWLACPVEYKRGRPFALNADKMQLCAQAMCLEEMLHCPTIETAYIYYGETKKREAVALDFGLRESVRNTFAEMREYYERSYTPRVKPAKHCANCSLQDICVPEMPEKGSVAAYVQRSISQDW